MSDLTLQDRVDVDLKQAMRDRDDVAKLTLRSVKTALTQASKEEGEVVLDDEAAEAIIQIEAKRRRDAAAEYKKAGRQDRVDEELAELAVLERYLPKQLSEAEIETIVTETIAELGADSMRDMSKVMPAVLAKTGGLADGKAVNQVVRRQLQG